MFSDFPIVETVEVAKVDGLIILPSPESDVILKYPAILLDLQNAGEKVTLSVAEYVVIFAEAMKEVREFFESSKIMSFVWPKLEYPVDGNWLFGEYAQVDYRPGNSPLHFLVQIRLTNEMKKQVQKSKDGIRSIVFERDQFITAMEEVFQDLEEQLTPMRDQSFA